MIFSEYLLTSACRFCASSVFDIPKFDQSFPQKKQYGDWWRVNEKSPGHMIFRTVMGNRCLQTSGLWVANVVIFCDP